MNVVEKVNLILKKANISKVNLSKYLGVSRQMVYNYFDGDDLSKLPNEKCQLLFNLLDVTSEKEILDINITNDYLQRVGSKIFDTRKSTPKKEESIDLAGLKKDEIMLIGEISQMLKNILIENKGREGEAYNTVEYVHHFIENLSTTKELKYILGYFSKNFGYTDPNKFAFDENNQYILESIMYSAMTLYSNGGASRTKLTESHRRWEAMLNSKKEEKLTRTQELNTAKIRALRELGYDEIDKSNASEVLDKILYFEGDRHASYRILRGVKNRFGSTNEIGVFEMREEGLAEVPNPSEFMLEGRPAEASGAVTACSMEGTRPILLEVQALVSKTNFGLPRRTAAGVDYNRVNLLMAVLEKRCRYALSGYDAYVNIAGGMKMNEPALDLAIVMALISSYKDRPLDEKTIVFGEVGLSGEVRAVSMAEQRVHEAVKMGFTRCILPMVNVSKLKPRSDIRLEGVANVREAIGLL